MGFVEGVGRITIETANVSFDEAHCLLHPECLPGDYVMLALGDTGAGMSEAALQHLFEPFFTTKEVGQGTGLGLATVYGVVKQNEGFIQVLSEAGKGTTFRIYLPRLRSHSVSESKPAEAEPDRGRETVLVVEDEQVILDMCRIMLEKLGYRVLTTCSPREALRLAAEHAGSLHLLLTDVILPEMNGRELSQRLRASYPELKHLYMSGYTADVIAHQGMLEEGVRFIQKPFTMRSLAARVREVLDQA
jgi:CheY-like chemotaxis protein